MTTKEQTDLSVIHNGSVADLAEATSILLAAFARDLPNRWLYPNTAQYIEYFPRFIRAFAGRAFDSGGVFFSADRKGVALWFPPGIAPDEQAIVELLQESVEPQRLDVMFRVFEQMDHYHPHAPMWYLPLIGVLPSSQGQGVGQALLRHTLAICDEQGLPAYLEATSPWNTKLYQAHGFKPIGKIEVDEFPTLVPMLRRPQRGSVPPTETIQHTER